MAYISNPTILDDDLLEGTFADAPKSGRPGRSRSESFDASSGERQMQKTVSLEESIYNHSLRVVKSVSTGPTLPSPVTKNPIEYTVSYEEKMAENRTVNENKKEFLQRSMIPIFRIVILGMDNTDHIAFLKKYIPNCNVTPKCHYDDTVNYYTTMVDISTQQVILKVCNMPYDLLNPTNDYLEVYIRTTHIVVLLVDSSMPDLFSYLEMYLTKIRTIGETVNDTIPVIVVLKKNGSSSHPNITKKALKSFFASFPNTFYYEFASYTDANAKIIFDKTIQIIAQKIQAPLDQMCSVL